MHSHTPASAEEQLSQLYPSLGWSSQVQLRCARGPVNVSIVGVLSAAAAPRSPMMIAKSFDMPAPRELDKHKDPAPLLRHTQDNSGGTGPGHSRVWRERPLFGRGSLARMKGIKSDYTPPRHIPPREAITRPHSPPPRLLRQTVGVWAVLHTSGRIARALRDSILTAPHPALYRATITRSNITRTAIPRCRRVLTVAPSSLLRPHERPGVSQPACTGERHRA
jgi:hypothetical protein